MGEPEQTESPGAQLVRIRWAKSTPEQRAEQARKMVAGQVRARRRKARLAKLLAAGASQAEATPKRRRK